MNVHVYKTTLK